MSFWLRNFSGAMSMEEVRNLEDALLFHRSHELELQVRSVAAPRPSARWAAAASRR
jgi:hypothetical protein